MVKIVNKKIKKSQKVPFYHQQKIVEKTMAAKKSYPLSFPILGVHNWTRALCRIQGGSPDRGGGGVRSRKPFCLR